ncbi:acyltransferase [Pseudaminobacter arsenicus]|uniref:Acyltransferase n=1 Tax=Borborobacter arsenicus TaxID=1851146 RepID=A0A432VAC3_9HYPH|nr:acyltransferase [Pseudaminobacter arsenicus]RUM99043.1 acyltransferase [Pseudaminobacter arsenicus]
MQHIYGFNALRAFSVLLVILSHVGIVQQVQSPFWKQFFTVFNANYGVKTFFVLSGFLITILLIKEYEKTGGINVLHFMARRALRILPLYFLVLALLSVFIWAGIAQPAWAAMWYSALYVFNFIPKADTVNYLSHLWSLAVEEQYYLIWPFVFALLSPRRGFLVAGCVAFITICYFSWTAPWPQFSDTHYTNRWTIPAIYPILFGSLMAIVNAPLFFIWRSPVALAISLAAISLPLFLPLTAAIEFAGTAGIAGVIGWVFLNQHRRAVHLMDWGPIGYIGVISYGLYMWQGILTGNGPYRVTAGWPPEPLIGAALTFIVAPLSFHLFERPISNMRRYFRSSRPVLREMPTSN